MLKFSPFSNMTTDCNIIYVNIVLIVLYIFMLFLFFLVFHLCIKNDIIYIFKIITYERKVDRKQAASLISAPFSYLQNSVFVLGPNVHMIQSSRVKISRKCCLSCCNLLSTYKRLQPMRNRF
jgi:hypothetical protein